MIGELIIKLLHARTNAHILHLGTTSFAKHKALNDFYDEIVDLVDTLAEAYQGDYGLILRSPNGTAYLITVSDAGAVSATAI